MMITGMVLGGLIVGGLFTLNSDVAEPENPLTASHFNRLDTSGDGALTLKEYLKGLEHLSVRKVTRNSTTSVPASSLEFIVENENGADTKETPSKDTPTGTEKNVPNGAQNKESSLEISDPVSRAFSTVNLINSLPEGHPECVAALTEIDRAELAREFYRLDVNEDNLVDLEEFTQIRLLPSLLDVRQRFNKLDGDNNGTLSFREMHRLYIIHVIEHLTSGYGGRTGHMPTPCKSAFEKSRLGHTNSNEPVTLVQSYSIHKWALSPSITPEGMKRETYLRLDLNKDETLSFDEFISWYM